MATLEKLPTLFLPCHHEAIPVRSGNMTTGENMTTKSLPYQTPAIGYKCLPGFFGPINATTSPPTCDRPVNTTETLASSSNTSVASTFAHMSKFL